MRAWKVFVFYSSHTDPGWHDLPERVMARHARYLDEVARYCDETKDQPEHRRFIFTAESAWTIDYYERHRSSAEFERLMACCRRGQLEIGALYAQVHTDLCGHEELARLTHYAARLKRRYGVPVDAAMLNDVSEGYTMGLPQVLARSGIRGLILGPGVKAVAKGIQPDLPRLFEWRTPDGSAVLVGWTPGHWTYADGTEAGFRGEETGREFEALGDAYPYDAFFRFGGKGDNEPPTLDALRLVEGYQERLDTKSIRLARVGEFIAHIRRHFPDRAPVYQGDNPNSWADGTLSLARETALYRCAQSGAIAAETLAALALAVGDGAPYPDERIADVYRTLHLYADHTWGLDLESGVGAGSRLTRHIAQGVTVDTGAEVPTGATAGAPLFAEWERNWDAKQAYAATAARLVDETAAAALAGLCARVAVPGPSLVVWNTSSWPRTDVVQATWPEGYGDDLALRDARDGRAVAWQREIDDAGAPRLVFVAEVPSMGYACVRVGREGPRTEARHRPEPEEGAGVGGDPHVIESRHYRVEADLRRGTIRSIWDKELGRELVDQGARYGLNEYIHADVTEGYEGVGGHKKAGMAHGEGTRYLPDTIEEVTTHTGPVFSTLRVRGRVTAGPAPATVTRTVMLYESLKRIDIIDDVDKAPALSKEQIYVAFPFAIPGPVATHLELPYAAMRWDRDILPGCWRGYSSVQHWLDVSGPDYGVTWSSLDAPVVCVGGITSNEWNPTWHRAYVPDNGHIYSYIMDNIWNCNYALWQGGPTRFAYRLTSHVGPCDGAEATRFGWGNAAPLRACAVDRRDGLLAADAFSALQVDTPNVLATALKRADDGRGWIVRLYETGGRARTHVRLAIGFITPRSAELNTLAEERIADLSLDGGTVAISLAAHELATVRIR